jgi:hypothetical protein
MYSPASAGYLHPPAAMYGRPSLGYGIPAPSTYGRPDIYRAGSARTAARPLDHYTPLGQPAGSLAALVSRDHGGFQPDNFLDPGRTAAPVERDDGRLFALAREAFQATTGFELGDIDLSIRFCTRDELRQAHGPGWSEGIMGFSRNRGSRGTSEVFVRHDSLDKLLLTLGHEIGHVLSPTLPDGRDEEAKAFAFSMAWMQAIRRHDIAGLATAVLSTVEPAHNGLHDTGLDFVLSHVSNGEDPLAIFRMLAKQEISVITKPELIIMED